jgi:hypothetical protein
MSIDAMRLVERWIGASLGVFDWNDLWNAISLKPNNHAPFHTKDTRWNERNESDVPFLSLLYIERWNTGTISAHVGGAI